MAIAPRDLRNHYGDLLARAEAGESLDVVRDGRVVATLGPPRRPLALPAGGWSRPSVPPSRSTSNGSSRTSTARAGSTTGSTIPCCRGRSDRERRLLAPRSARTPWQPSSLKQRTSSQSVDVECLWTLWSAPSDTRRARPRSVALRCLAIAADATGSGFRSSSARSCWTPERRIRRRVHHRRERLTCGVCGLRIAYALRTVRSRMPFSGARPSAWSEDHIARHRVTMVEVNEVLAGRHRESPGREASTIITGQTQAGRYLLIVAVTDSDGGDDLAFIVTARPMTEREKRTFKRSMT
jgi:uncharacterized protein